MAKILLADDDQATRDLVKRALEMDGHTITVAEDGTGAKAAFDAAQSALDLIVTDVEMPGIDGITFAQHALSAAANVKVLLMSGYAEQLEKGRAIGSPRLSVISKPFTLDQIRKTLTGILS